MLHVVSSVPGIDWPAIPNPRACQLLAVQFQLEQSQWLSPAELLSIQVGQLARLLPFAQQHVPFYRERFAAAGIVLSSSFSLDDWARIPLLTRDDVQRAGSSLHCPRGPKEHGPRSQTATSGSTGMPVVTLGTTVTRLFWSAFTLRQHIWHSRDLRGKLAAIRATADNTADVRKTRESNWGNATIDIVRTGPAVTLDIHTPIDQQVEWLIAEQPNYLLTYPSNLIALASTFAAKNLTLPTLREARTIGEVCDRKVRKICRDVWNVPVVDVYSSEEFGHLAIQCPRNEHYHVMAENVLLELLDDAGKPCKPGEVGRVVLTSLHNFAMPLIRYEIGDYAELGDRCECGRGLPVLKRILGRVRNMAILPDGRHVWPALHLDGASTAEMPPIQQFQLVQKTTSQAELRLVMPRPLDAQEELLLRGWVTKAVGFEFDLSIRYVEDIPRNARGKYEDFRCEVRGES
ncbi:MAG: hypothetical protein K1X74_11030 [Pirellulales bacterium]|nr:hypothetical protein [Pirellulales bacterium]